MATYLIGRGRQAQVVIEDATVSRVHAELTVLGEDAFRLRDLGSKYGTFVKRDDSWFRADDDLAVSGADEVRLGEHRTTVAALSALLDRSPSGAPRVDLPRAPSAPSASPSPAAAAARPGEPGRRPSVERDPETGEIIRH